MFFPCASCPLHGLYPSFSFQLHFLLDDSMVPIEFGDQNGNEIVSHAYEVGLHGARLLGDAPGFDLPELVLEAVVELFDAPAH